MDGVAGSNEPREWTLGRLLREAGLPHPSLAYADPTIVTHIADDSREVIPGCCFVAVRGERFDGHDFIEAAVRAGAACVVTQRAVSVPSGVVEVRVEDSRLAVARLAAAFDRLQPGQRDHPLRLIGVTGTNGKSTTSELLRAILSAAGERVALLGTIRYDLAGKTMGSDMTTPAPVALCRMLGEAADAGVAWAVMEVSSHALDQRRCDGLHFSAGVFTNLTGDHLDYHGDADAYLAAKKRLFDLLMPDAVAVINAEDGRAEELVADCRAGVVRYGLESGEPGVPDARRDYAPGGAGSVRPGPVLNIDAGRLDATARVDAMDAAGSRYRIVGDGRELSIRSTLIGRHNVMNALAAAATAWALGVDDEAIRRGIEETRAVRGRLEPVQVAGQSFAVFVDYAHTDDALQNVLSALRPLTRGRLACVFGCGGDRDRTKRPRMAEVVARFADWAVVTSDNPRTEDPNRIIEEALTGFPGDSGASRCRVVVEADRTVAIRLAIEGAGPGDTVLIAGKGHEDYQIIGQTRRHFDDVETARRFLEARFCPDREGAEVASAAGMAT